MEWNHFDENGNAVMVDVSEKEITERIAVASGKIRVNDAVMSAIVNHTAKKGDVLTVARVAGIMGTKQTSNLIPMCHPLCLNKCTVDFEVKETENIIKALCTVKVSGKTGVEMEALMGVNVALLTQDNQPPVTVNQTAKTDFVSPASFSVSTWISQVHGIRAGPQRLS
mgnify:CR=1 FL=1